MKKVLKVLYIFSSSIFHLKDDLFGSLPRSVISLPFSFHQAHTDREKDITVTPADTKKVKPIHKVSPTPGTAELAVQSEA